MEIGLLSELTHLDLSQNSLTGDTPEELGRLDNLQSLKLSGSSLTGCVPLHWRDIATNDLSSLNLPYCAPPPPDSFSIGTPMETSVTASWGAVAGASKYRVEYWSNHSAGLGVDDSVTGTTHTVEGLTCDTRYQFWVRAQGDGTTYADGWSAPSRGRLGATTECLTPAFHEETYAIEVLARSASVGSVVGTVSATDPNDDAVTYSITGGNEGNKFNIGGSTGEITMAGSLSDRAVTSYTLTVQASDGTNTGTVMVEIAILHPTISFIGLGDALVERDVVDFTLVARNLDPSLEYRMRVEASGTGISLHRYRCVYHPSEVAIAAGGHVLRQVPRPARLRQPTCSTCGCTTTS